MTHDIGTPLKIDILGKHGCQINTSRNGIPGNVDTKLSNQECECYSSIPPKRHGRTGKEHCCSRTSSSLFLNRTQEGIWFPKKSLVWVELGGGGSTDDTDYGSHDPQDGDDDDLRDDLIFWLGRESGIVGHVQDLPSVQASQAGGDLHQQRFDPSAKRYHKR